MKRLQIFRAGKHTASNGKVIQFTEAQLKAAVAAYDPKIHEAPIVVGHPEGDAPAYGWIGALTFNEGAIEAEPIQVDPAFADLVKQGRFKKISASFYEPDAEGNPKPGAYYLRHVGFLGAQPPAVKGLRNVDFAADAKGIVEFTDWDAMNVARLFRSLRDFLVTKFGQEEADRALPGWTADELLISAAQAPNPPSLSYQESDMTKEELERREAELKTREEKLQTGEASFAERSTKLTTAEAAARKRGHVDFVDGLVKAGKLLPVHKDGLVAFMCSLPAGTIEFGEGDKKQTPATGAWLEQFLTGQPVHVDFNERGAGDVTTSDTDADPNAVAAKAIDFIESERQAGRVVNIAEAVAHVNAKASA